MNTQSDQPRGRAWRIAGGLFIGLILAVWAFGDRRLDELRTSGDTLTAVLLGSVLILTVMGIACARRWQRLAGSRPAKSQLSLATGLLFLVGLWFAFAVFTLIPDVLTQEDHPTWNAALVAAAWRATAWTCASIVCYALSRKHPF